MKAMVAKTANEPFVAEERDLPEPGPGQVRVRVHACGICFSDHLVEGGLWPGLELPRVPGHEIAGTIDAVGSGVDHLKVGARVGVGWYGGHDGSCPSCLKGDFVTCANGKITGISSDGGYQEYMVADATAVAEVPDAMPFELAAPLLCAGVTTFNALRNADVRAGDVVAVQGLGGLGHLGVQFARAMGFETVAISRGRDKEDFARQLGAHHYVDAQSEDIMESFGKLGGARVILATAPNAAAISALVPGLGIDSTLLVVAAPFEPLSINPLDLLSRRARVQGWPSGTAIDSTEALRFAQLHGIKPMIESFPLEDANTAYAKMMDGSVRFRSVLQMQ